MNLMKDTGADMTEAQKYLNPDILKPSFDYDEILSLVA